MFAFFGMESALQVSGEVRDAARAVPRAIALAVAGVGVLYIAVQLVAQGILGSALADPQTAKAPLAAAAVQFAGSTGSTLILIAMIVSTFGFMTATMLSTPRTLFALAVDGYLPQPLARVHRAHHTPYIAIAIQGVIVCAIAITGTYVKLAIMANVAILLVYLATCLAVWRLRRLDAGGGVQEIVTHVLQLSRAHALVEVALRQEIAEQCEGHGRNLDARDVNVGGVDAPLRFSGRSADRPRGPLLFSLDHVQHLIERVDHRAEACDRNTEAGRRVTIQRVGDRCGQARPRTHPETSIADLRRRRDFAGVGIVGGERDPRVGRRTNGGRRRGGWWRGLPSRRNNRRPFGA